MLFVKLIKTKIPVLSKIISQSNLALSLFLLAVQKKTIFVLLRQDIHVLSAARTAGAANVCKIALASN